ncbi:DUF2750 domain-containing protein [Bacillus sp. FJAT-27986]|uniref:DUF2750 domain-containing protein n=1 Tax=Bacillus sp. FJAT-27986 TaxID=1743146 RepID=UPI00080AED8F|nr:DUF2750 domain-containing protein [Bacillus sp. FJAT-27986]OCA88613.1 hypothetical protein A8L44_17105 [Bacillus sp. FJAT-27986]
MNQKELDSIIKQPSNIRYEYLVADYEEVWGLYDDGWATAQDDDGNMLIPFFPRKEFAEYCAVNEWNNFKAEPIDLNEFIENWLVGMRKDRVKPSVFPINEDSVMVEIDVLLRDLNSELENY